MTNKLAICPGKNLSDRMFHCYNQTLLLISTAETPAVFACDNVYSECRMRSKIPWENLCKILMISDIDINEIT